jgi:hypothetical protein
MDLPGVLVEMFLDSAEAGSVESARGDLDVE